MEIKIYVRYYTKNYRNKILNKGAVDTIKQINENNMYSNTALNNNDLTNSDLDGSTILNNRDSNNDTSEGSIN